MIPVARLSDQHSCPIPGHGVTPIASASADTLFNMLGAARVGDLCGCGAVITVGFPSVTVDYRPLAHLGSPTSHGGSIISGSPDSYGGNSGGGFAFSGTGPIVDFAKLGAFNEDGSVNDQVLRRLLDDPNIEERARKAGALVGSDTADSGCVFAKSCVSVPAGSTEAGTACEPAKNFGTITLLGTTGAVTPSGAALLGRVSGSMAAGAAESMGSWAIRGLAAAGATVGTVASTLLLALWPRDMGDSTLFSAEQLAMMKAAATRVRFQFRKAPDGSIQVYGLHTSAQSGMASVPTVEAKWNPDKSAMEAQLEGGINIIWTPNDGPIPSEPLIYPTPTESADTLLVHPIPEQADSGIEIYPAGDDITWQDVILTFPDNPGVPPLYVVFAKPAVNPLEVGPYNDLRSRSKKDGLDIDHIPSQKALESYISSFDDVRPDMIADYLSAAPSIAIPQKVHQKYSETYGGRNTIAKQVTDAADLRAAVDSNFDAIKPGLLAEGFTDADVEAARTELHALHQEQGWY
jgi:uncharacterized Zn-binding protein involved in type VI secretion